MKLNGLLFIIIVTSSCYGQVPDTAETCKLHISANGETGIVTYYGALNQRSVPFSSNNRPSSQLGLFGQYKAFLISVHYAHLQFGEANNNYQKAGNFKATGNAIGIDLSYHSFYKKRVSVELGAGIEKLLFNLSEDLQDEQGEPFYYWSDGTIRNMPQTFTNLFIAKQVTRDYKYSTDEGNFKSLLASLSADLNLRISRRLAANFRSTLFLPLQGKLDNIKSPSAAFLFFNRVGVTSYFGKAPRQTENPRYKDVDFQALEMQDTDGDGVKDFKDRCPDTPKGVKVDHQGCLIDSDGDGIPDIYDKEPHTKKRMLTDKDGIGQAPSKEIIDGKDDGNNDEKDE